ncbi:MULTISPECIES: hypothetical protein [Actinosynnema]|uniref:hypothetical protein n=1 Tax=Actinosynnema TaxID=40566 RepID=UPI0020A3B1E7|nr:hypothetical protein [Actinosynnema pretiosum]MCP2094827.1 hypothetical protein [Actinosynnema pretiosum]
MTGAPLPAVHQPADGRVRGGAAFAWLWIAGSLLAGAALALLAALPPLPTSADTAAAWVGTAGFQLTWSGELLFFATVAWGAGAVGAFGTRGAGSPVRRAVALVALAVALVAFLVVLLGLGRLVYPVLDAAPAADVLVLLVSEVIGAVHLALLALAVVATALQAPVRRGHRAATAAGIGFGALFLVGSYPWLLPTWANLLVAGSVAGWGALVGAAALSRD